MVSLALIALNVAACVAAAAGNDVPRPFAHATVWPVAVSSLFLWLFGDNVEARLGRFALIVVYLAGGLVPGLGAAGGVTAVLGSYFMILPQSRIFMLVPLPVLLVEVPAVVFLGIWAALHLTQLVAAPRTAWMFLLAFAIGALAARLQAPRVRW